MKGRRVTQCRQTKHLGRPILQTDAYTAEWQFDFLWNVAGVSTTDL
jgi:hypothetical protein